MPKPAQYQPLAATIVIAWMMFIHLRFLRYAADFWGNQCAISSTRLMQFPDAFRVVVKEARLMRHSVSLADGLAIKSRPAG